MPRFPCALACAPFVPWALHASAQAQTATPIVIANAQTRPSDDILVVGQKTHLIAVEPRGLSVSLGDDQFSRVNAFSVEDLIKYAPDFFVRSRYIGDNNGVPGFRGTHSTQSARTLVMVDGFVISNFLGNSFSYPPAWGVVGPNEVEQFDIVYGPYSSRYVGNSMGGIINITTRPPNKTEAFFNLQNMYQPYDQFNSHYDLWGYSAEGGFAWKPNDSPFGLRFSARRLINQAQPMQYYQLGYSATVYNSSSAGTPITGAVMDPKLMPVTQPNNQPVLVNGDKVVTPVVGDYSLIQSRQDQARTELRFDQGDVHGELLFAYWWNEEKTLDPATYLTDNAGKPFYGNRSGLVSTGGHTYSLNAATSFRQGLFFKNEYLAGGRIDAPIAGFDVKLNVSMLRFDRQDTYQSNGFAAGLADGPGQWTHQGPTGWYTGNWLATRRVGRHGLTFGVDANLYQTDQSVFDTAHWRNGSGATLSTRTFGRTNMIGAFAEDVIAFGDATKLTLGVRYDRWHAYGGGLTAIIKTGLELGRPVTQTYGGHTLDAWSPKVAVHHVFSANWVAELSLAMATRFPTVGELFQGSLNGDGTFNSNSFDPNLKPEKSKDANLLVRHRFGAMTLTASAFYQRVHNTIFNFIGFNQSGVSTSDFKNIDVTRQYGLELIGETHNWPVSGLDMDGNAAWIDAITVRNASDPASVGVQFPRIPRWRLNGNLRYRLTPKLQTVLGVRYASRPNSDIDGYYRGNDYGFTSELFALDVRATFDATEKTRFSAGVNNLTNVKAWVYHPYPERTFLIEAGFKL